MNNKFSTFYLKWQKYVFFASVFLVGCGGGGESNEGSAQPTQTPAPVTPTTFQPNTSVPAGTYTDPDLLQAFARTNEIRKQVGLGLITQSSQLDLAAQRHTNYVVELQGLVHFEEPGRPFFSGVTWTNRAAAAGYTEGVIDEVILAKPYSGARAVNDFMSTAYHRIPFLNYANFDIGFGIGQSSLPYLRGEKFLVANFGYTGSRRQGAPETPYVVWPAAGTVIDRLTQVSEFPTPGGTGYAVSIHVDPAKTLVLNSFELRENGSPVPAALHHGKNDGNLSDAQYTAILSPITGLKNSTVYTARFMGSTDGKPLNVEWSFSTPQP